MVEILAPGVVRGRNPCARPSSTFHTRDRTKPVPSLALSPRRKFKSISGGETLILEMIFISWFQILDFIPETAHMAQQDSWASPAPGEEVMGRALTPSDFLSGKTHVEPPAVKLQ